MSKADFVRRLMALLTTLVVVGASVLPRASHGETAGIDPWAEQLLKAATDYLAGQPRFSVETRSTIEVVLRSGQKIQFDHAVALSVQRPNKLRAERHGDLVDQVFYYDGQAGVGYSRGVGVNLGGPVNRVGVR